VPRSGINYFDTADQYNNGRSEEILGELSAASATTGDRDQVLQPDGQGHQCPRRIAPAIVRRRRRASSSACARPRRVLYLHQYDPLTARGDADAR
jgi:hypothetical protein